MITEKQSPSSRQELLFLPKWFNSEVKIISIPGGRYIFLSSTLQWQALTASWNLSCVGGQVNWSHWHMLQEILCDVRSYWNSLHSVSAWTSSQPTIQPSRGGWLPDSATSPGQHGVALLWQHEAVFWGNEQGGIKPVWLASSLT